MSLETDVQHMLRTLTKKQMNAVAATWNEVMSKGNTGHLDQITWDALLPSYNPSSSSINISGYYCRRTDYWFGDNTCSGDPDISDPQYCSYFDSSYFDNPVICRSEEPDTWETITIISGPYATEVECDGNCY